MIKLLLSLFVLPILLSGANNVNAKTINVYDIPVKTIDEQTLNLKKFKGKKPVYLKFWASWCQPCRKQMPHLQHAYETYGSDIAVIAVNIDMNDSRADIAKIISEFNLTLPIVIDQNSNLAQVFNLIATPFHVLLDKNGTIVHTGHEASPQLENKLKTLASQETSNLAEIKLELNNGPNLNLNINHSTSLVYFASAWCDWYLKDSRPQMSSSCISAQKQVNQLYAQYPELNWTGVLTRLWTGEKEIKEYQKKYHIRHPLYIDKTNSNFIKYSVTDFPTLIAFTKGKEIFRLHDFSDPKVVAYKLKSLSVMQ